ncbi:adenine nucleotide alpha hydrolase [Pararhizobium haloflavum]|uniref:adenine nucleotide alpha hydrolase n=1 Tax=Pararhizobium haloflavum TaxID=2037914 RepID=UPI000C1A61AF|nr:adenine nucleotide alpha hydrolase [Pararhizobium haloflavum]
MSDVDIAAVEAGLEGLGPVAIAVSGGIDSLTLATIAGRCEAVEARMIHALSPAVPAEATERVHAMARQEGWQLRLINAAEFDRSEYVSNPVNRCFFCKQALYTTIANAVPGRILSGTNADDLGEYRPGLDAARLARVRHPFAELDIGKSTIRAMARTLGLGDLSELPASPCLSSRVETGIAISPPLLAQIHKAETAVRNLTGARVVRCRYRREGIVIELEDAILAGLRGSMRDALRDAVCNVFEGGEESVSFARYRVGSAFVAPAAGSGIAR